MFLTQEGAWRFIAANLAHARSGLPPPSAPQLHVGQRRHVVCSAVSAVNLQGNQGDWIVCTCVRVRLCVRTCV